MAAPADACRLGTGNLKQPPHQTPHGTQKGSLCSLCAINGMIRSYVPISEGSTVQPADLHNWLLIYTTNVGSCPLLTVTGLHSTLPQVSVTRTDLFTQPPREGRPSSYAHTTRAPAPPPQSWGGVWTRILYGVLGPCPSVACLASREEARG